MEVKDKIKLENVDSVAYITEINSLTSIEGADKIELAKAEGWTSIVQKGIHKVGDKVMCIITDAVIPQPKAEAWGVAQYLRKGNRVRTIKLKGVYSECILIPLVDLGANQYALGEDLMKELGIFKYEPPARTEQLPSGKKIRYSCNPNFHVYHQFPNQKNTPNMFNDEDEVVITRKIHGCNARYGIVKKTKFSILDRLKKFFRLTDKWSDYEYVYGSHNVQKLDDSKGYYAENYWKEIDRKYDIKNKLWSLFKEFNTINDVQNLVIYGEIYGPGVQGELYDYGKSERAFVGFDVKTSDYLPNLESNTVFDILKLPVVEALYIGKWNKTVQNDKVLNQFFINSKGKKIPHEGVVVACPTGNRQKISKVINPDYLIYSEKNDIPDSH